MKGSEKSWMRGKRKKKKKAVLVFILRPVNISQAHKKKTFSLSVLYYLSVVIDLRGKKMLIIISPESGVHYIFYYFSPHH